MKKWIEDILGITALKKEVKLMKQEAVQLHEEMDKRRKEAFKIAKDNLDTLGLVSQNAQDISNLIDYTGPKYITKKLNGYKSEHRFIELSMKIYFMDDGWRKHNPPYVKSGFDGVVDDYPDKVSNGTHLRHFMVKKLVLPGYGNDEKYDPNNEKYENTTKYLFGMTYKQLIEYMREHNYERVDNEMYSLNFYEI